MTDEAPPDKPDRPPLSLDVLRESLDRLGDLSLDLNDRIEEQTKSIKHATTMTNEARRAAETTKQQTDPDHYAEFAVNLIDDRMDKAMARMNEASQGLSQASHQAQSVLKQTENDLSATQRRLWEREQTLDQWKSRWWLFALGALALGLVMTLTLPWHLATNRYTCQVMVGYTWTTTTTGTTICVRYNE